MRRIAITGASGGLAQEIVKLLPEDQLMLIGRDANQLEDLYAFHQNKACWQLDIRDEGAIAACLRQIYQDYGPLDLLINNAGYAIYDDFDRLTTEDARQMFEINTFATMTFCQLVGHEMKKAGRGHIINIASMSGHIASAKSSLYSASKFAVIGYSNALRLELADKGVYVTSINLGPVATKFFDQADPDGNYLKSVERFLLNPQVVAKRIVGLFGKSRRELNLPWSLHLAYKFYTLFPVPADFLTRRFFNYK